MICNALKSLIAAAGLSLCLGVGSASAADAAPEKTYIIIHITFAPDRYEEGLKQIALFADYEAKHGVELVGSYTITVGPGNQMLNIWAADSYKAWSDTVDGYMSVVDVKTAVQSLVREDISLAARNPIVQPKVVHGH